MSAHMPETHLVRADNIEMLARRRYDFVFKPLHGLQGRGYSIVRPWGGRVYGVSRSVARATWRKDGFRNLA